MLSQQQIQNVQSRMNEFITATPSEAKLLVPQIHLFLKQLMALPTSNPETFHLAAASVLLLYSKKYVLEEFKFYYGGNLEALDLIVNTHNRIDTRIRACFMGLLNVNTDGVNRTRAIVIVKRTLKSLNLYTAALTKKTEKAYISTMVIYFAEIFPEAGYEFKCIVDTILDNKAN